MKKIIKCFLLILLVFQVVSCNNNSNPPNNGGSQIEDTNDGNGVGTDEEIFD